MVESGLTPSMADMPHVQHISMLDINARRPDPSFHVKVDEKENWRVLAARTSQKFYQLLLVKVVANGSDGQVQSAKVLPEHLGLVTPARGWWWRMGQLHLACIVAWIRH